jgi:hypothetical protein
MSSVAMHLVGAQPDRVSPTHAGRASLPLLAYDNVSPSDLELLILVLDGLLAADAASHFLVVVSVLNIEAKGETDRAREKTALHASCGILGGDRQRTVE